jgi:hypothetical protein
MFLFTNWETKRMTRLKETLMRKLEKGDPFYWVSVVLEALLFAELAVSMGAGIWPWISGQAPHGAVLRSGLRELKWRRRMRGTKRRRIS